jgi:hypothetical protein
LVRDIARELKTDGTFKTFTDHTLPFAEVNELMR